MARVRSHTATIWETAKKETQENEKTDSFNSLDGKTFRFEDIGCNNHGHHDDQYTLINCTAFSFISR